MGNYQQMMRNIVKSVDTLHKSEPATPDFVKMLMHFDEDPLIDRKGNVLTLYGGIGRSAAQSKFGGYSGLFEAYKYITVPNSLAWNFGSGDYTIDLWINGEGNSLRNGVRFWQYVDTNNSWYLTIGGAGNPLGFYFKIDGTVYTRYIATASYTAGLWYHIAVTRQGNTNYYFINGVLIGTTTDSHTIPNYDSPLYLGIANFSAGVPTFPGTFYIDEFRIIKGEAAWIDTFTPPTAPYSPSDV